MRASADFQRAFQRKRSASNDALVVHAVESQGTHPRIGISVGRKRIRRAHDRNRVKRILREVFRLTKSTWPPATDFVVVPRHKNLTFAHALIALPELARAAARRLGPRKPPPSGPAPGNPA